MALRSSEISAERDDSPNGWLFDQLKLLLNVRGFLVAELAETTETSGYLVVDYELFSKVVEQGNHLSCSEMMYRAFYLINGYWYYSAREVELGHLQVLLLEEL